MKRWVGLLLVWCAPALAGQVSFEDAGRVEVLGWSQDSRYFAWTAEEFTGGNTWGYWDVTTGSSKHFADQSGKAKWLEVHPLSPVKAGREGLNGAVAEIVVTKNKLGGKWSDKAVWTPGGYSGSELRVSRGGKSYISVDWFSSVDNARPIWAPDGKHLAWFLWSSGVQEEDSGFHLCFGSAGLPRVHVLGAPALLKTRAPEVRTTLDGQGFVTTYLGKALKARDTTVIYAAKGMDEEAAKAAKAIGGAKIEPLSWTVDADLVVALGEPKGSK